MIRQQVLTRARPVRLTTILDESLLRRPIGGHEVLAEQLAHLASMAERSNVVVRVLPESVGAHAAPDGSFEIFDLPDPYPTLACVETPAGVIYVEADGIQRFTTAFERVGALALSPEESVIELRKRER